ncbi:MAG: beta-1,4-mannooligosaccharide/beta-1,4-mannosyl-N-acetylglucosamine phosphorylase [Planctomycetota bacterium]|jgi:beta-1,4-mannooligosaccharide/beta-1,4-mannosyl-N-acetylglucosamine phosphorylase
MLERDPRAPLLTRADIPTATGLIDPSSVFNPGAVHFRGLDYLMLRVQARSRATSLVLASSTNGLDFEVADTCVKFDGIESETRAIHHIYDPRLTFIGDQVVVIFAADMDDACRLGVAVTDDMAHFRFLGFSEEASRNGVLFPEKVGGRYLRLERPNGTTTAGGVATGDAIRLSESPDLIHWSLVGPPVLEGRWRYWDELIGSGPPPVKTRRGWLHIYHGVATHFASSNIYQAGAVLMDLEDPSKVLARTWDNILEPREVYELTGQVPNVVFPSGWLVRDLDAGGFAADASEVLVYYGAADTCVARCRTTVGALLAACVEVAQ